MEIKVLALLIMLSGELASDQQQNGFWIFSCPQPTPKSGPRQSLLKKRVQDSSETDVSELLQL